MTQYMSNKIMTRNVENPSNSRELEHMTGICHVLPSPKAEPFKGN